MLDDFAVFILSHGRADNVITYKTLQRADYTGRVYIVIDNEDKQADRYYQNFGDKVIMFDKAAEAEKTDTGDNFIERNTVLFARNACFDIAEGLGIEYFLVLDDDYKEIRHRITDKNEYINDAIKSIDVIFLSMLEFYKSIECKSIAFAQEGDFIGGTSSPTRIELSMGKRRKAMNSFFCSTYRRFNFVSRMNDDVTTYATLGNKGLLFLTFPYISIQQEETQAQKGGLTEMYLDKGTYVKSFYTIMYQPSSVRVRVMGINKRLHHSIDWDTTVPCIISENFRKAE